MAHRAQRTDADVATRPITDPWTRSSVTIDRRRLILPVRLAAISLTGFLGVAAQTAREASSWRRGAAVVVVGVLTIVIVASIRARSKSLGVIVAALVLAGVGLAVAPAVTGGRQYVLAVAGTALAYLALTGRDSGDRTTAAHLPRTAMAAGPLLAAQVSWYRLAPQWLTLGFVLLAASLVLFADRFPRAAATTQQRVAVIVRVATTIAGAAILFPVALATLYLPGLVVRMARSVSVASRRDVAAWVPNRIGLDEHRRDATRPFGSTDPHVRRRRYRIGTVVGLVGGLIVVAVLHSSPGAVPRDGAVTDVPRSAVPPLGTDRRFFALEGAGIRYSDLPAYRGVDWADELQSHQTTADVASPLFNVSRGDRRTVSPSSCTCPELTVWFDGGSAAFGIGQRDGGTIASRLVELAGDAGISLHVVNISRAGSVLAADLDRVEGRLRDEPAPDLVIYYAGWNDVLSHVLNRFAQSPEGAVRPGSDPALVLENANAQTDAFLTSDVGAAAGEDTLLDYESLIERADEITRSTGVQSAFFFQPDATVNRHQLAGYETISNVSPDEVMASPLAKALEIVDLRLDRRVVNLRRVFDDVTEPTFAGLVHQNEVGASIVAQAIYDRLADTLADLAHSP